MSCTALQARRSRVRFPMLLVFLIDILLALGSTQPLIEMSTRIFPGG
jgi:predicted nucleic acid-binding Zn ribbon protein